MIATDPLIPLIGALWVAVSTVIVTTRVINERRDTILSGHLGTTPITVAHRQLILSYDWLPMVAASTLICGVMFLLLVLVPGTLRLDIYYRTICYVSAVVPLLGAVSWSIGSIFEFRKMKAVLEDALQAEAGLQSCEPAGISDPPEAGEDGPVLPDLESPVAEANER